MFLFKHAWYFRINMNIYINYNEFIKYVLGKNT